MSIELFDKSLNEVIKKKDNLSDFSMFSVRHDYQSFNDLLLLSCLS